MIWNSIAKYHEAGFQFEGICCHHVIYPFFLIQDKMLQGVVAATSFNDEHPPPQKTRSMSYCFVVFVVLMQQMWRSVLARCVAVVLTCEKNIVEYLPYTL